jgi:hypothetical protein
VTYWCNSIDLDTPVQKILIVSPEKNNQFPEDPSEDILCLSLKISISKIGSGVVSLYSLHRETGFDIVT